MKMLREMFGDDPNVVYGPTCTSGPLGGDAQIAAQMCLEDLGGLIFFRDPLSAHPHQADIESLCRLANVHNLLYAENPTTAITIMRTLVVAIEKRLPELMPSFFTTLESPCVKEYRDGQNRVSESLKAANASAGEGAVSVEFEKMKLELADLQRRNVSIYESKSLKDQQPSSKTAARLVDAKKEDAAINEQ